MKVKKFKTREAFMKALKPNVYVRVGDVLSGFPITKGELKKVGDVSHDNVSVWIESQEKFIGVNASWFCLEIHYIDTKIPKLPELEFGLVLNEHRKIHNPISSLSAEERSLREQYEGVRVQLKRIGGMLRDVRGKIAETAIAQDVDISKDISEQLKRLEWLVEVKSYKGFTLEDMILTGYTGNIWNSDKEHPFDWRIKVFIKDNTYVFQDTNGVATQFCVGNIRETLADMLKTRRYSQFFEMIHEFLIKQQKGEFKGM